MEHSGKRLLAAPLRVLLNRPSLCWGATVRGASMDSMHSRRWIGALALAFLLACPGPDPVDDSGPTAGWPTYGNSPGGGRYSPLTQITKHNVDDLEIAWTYHTGDVPEEGTKPGSSFQATPILQGETLYFCTPFNRVIALHAETGSELWTYDPEVDWTDFYLLNCRGVVFWSEPVVDSKLACQQRIFSGTIDARLLALDAMTGLPCEDFGDAGQVDLSSGIGHIHPGEYGVTSPPVVLGDQVILGTMVLDNIRKDSPGGVVRSYDVRTGELRWAWDPVPPGSDPLPLKNGERFRRGTANAWAPLSVDSERNLVFVPTGNASSDYFAGDRGGLDYYSSSVLALDGATGKIVWHFQMVHHDVWDYDTPAQPTLFDFPSQSGPIPALVQGTKMGHLFILNRETGEPIFPIEERPVPQGGVPGEALSPTQPFPTKPPPIHPVSFGPDDIWGLTPWDRGKCQEEMAGIRNEGIFTPPSLEGSLHYPGAAGGVNWGSVAIDPVRHRLVVNINKMPIYVRLIPREEFNEIVGDETFMIGYEWQRGSPYGLERRLNLSPFGLPCYKPPWGSLIGVDLAKGEIVFDRPFGTTRDMAPWPFWFEIGTPSMGGPIMTASGLTFIGGATDDFLRAFDSETGDELWKGRLPAGGQATPMTYRLRPTNRQFVVIAAGGHELFQTTPGDAIVAFALP